MHDTKIAFVLVCLLILLFGCFRTTWHTKVITAGIYESSDSVEFGDLTFEKIKFEIVEISKDEFDIASNIDVIEDLATPSTDRKYYSIKMNIKELGVDDVNYPITYVRSGGYDGIPERYVFSFDFSYENQINSVSVYIGVGRSSRLEVQMDADASYSFGEIVLWMVD